MDAPEATRREYIKRLEAAVRQARIVKFMPVKLKMALEELDLFLTYHPWPDREATSGSEARSKMIRQS